jgi:epoxyqueuosine reductase QueG
MSIATKFIGKFHGGTSIHPWTRCWKGSTKNWNIFNQNFGCAICLAVCPFSVSGYEQVKSRFKGNPKAPQFRIPVATNLEADQPNPVEFPQNSTQG